MKLRLLITKKCNRNCSGCCNQMPLWKEQIHKLPIYDGRIKYSKVMLTGGEPLLRYRYPSIINKIRSDQPKNTPIYMYTAGNKGRPEHTYLALHFLDGMCYTLHEQEDVKDFLSLLAMMKIQPNPTNFKNLSLRLNIFKGIEIDHSLLKNWKVKTDMDWIQDCPLPEGEEFRRWA